MLVKRAALYSTLILVAVLSSLTLRLNSSAASDDKATVKKTQEAAETSQEDTAENDTAKKDTAEKDLKVKKQTVDPRTRGIVIKKSSAAARAKGEITFDDLKFEIKKDAPFEDVMLDKDVKSLEGLNVKLSGYILPSTLFKETDIDRFVLVRDNRECCFGPGAALFDCVIVEMKPGKTTDFVTRPVTVQGKLEIDTKTYKYPNGKGPRGASHMAIFRIEGEQVK